MSVEQIAAAVGIKAPSLYKHYKGKKDIFDAIFEETARRYEAFTDTISVHVQDSEQDILLFEQITADDLIEKVKSLIEYSLHDEYVSLFRKMIQFAGIAVLIVMLVVGLTITIATIIGQIIYAIKYKKENKKIWIKILLRTFFVIGVSIAIFPIMFFYMLISENRKQEEQTVIREQQAIEEANTYDENMNAMGTFLEKDNMTGFRLIVTDSAAGSKYYEFEKTLDGGNNWRLQMQPVRPSQLSCPICPMISEHR